MTELKQNSPARDWLEAELADTLLRQCPLLSILASSREPLNIAGETKAALAACIVLCRNIHGFQ